MTETRRDSTPWGLVILLGALTAMGPLAIDMYLPALPSIGRALHASPAQTQSTMSAFLFGMGVGQLFYGPMSDRMGRRIPLLAGTAIYVLASFVCVFAMTPAMLIGGRFVQALGACAGGVVSRAVVRDRFNHTETARMLSLMMLIMGGAPIFAPLLGGALLSLGGWQLNFVFMGGFGIVLLVASVLRLKESRSDATRAHAGSETPIQAYFALLREPRLVGYALGGALNGAVIFTYVASSPDLLINSYHIAPSHFGWVFGINGIGLIGSNQVNRILLRWHTPDRILQVAGPVSIGFAVLLVIAATTGIGERWTVLPLLFALLSSFGFLSGNTMAGALNVDPRRAGAISALMGFASFVTGALSSALAGLLHDGTARPMAVIILLALIGSTLSLRLLAMAKPRELAVAP